MNRIALVDVSSILHSCKHSIGKKHKLSHKEQYTFIIYGFLLRLKTIARNSLADQLVFCLDSDRSIRRARYFRQYKEGRNKQTKTPDQEYLDEISYPQFNIVKSEIIPGIGFKNVFMQPGREADDIMAIICQEYNEHEIVIVSSDEDMYQCLARNVSIMKPRDFRWYNITNFRAEFGIDPVDWKKVKMYAGCKSDFVPGIPGVGNATAIKFLHNELSPTTKAFQAIMAKENKIILRRNKIITSLPLVGTKPCKIVRDDSLSRKALIDICKRYNFKSIYEDIKDFSLTLKLR